MRCAAPTAASSLRSCCCTAAVPMRARVCWSNRADGCAPRFRRSAFLKAPPLQLRMCRPTSAAGDVLFNKVRVLQAGELDGKAILEMAHDTTLHLAERNKRADRGSLIRRDGGARFR